MCRMLFVLLVTLTAVTASPAHAAPLGIDERADEIDQLLKSGRRTKTAGQVLVGIGCVGALAATILGPFSFGGTQGAPADRPPGSPTPSDVAPLLGAAIGLGISTVVLLAVGIPLMAEGDSRVAHARKLVGSAPIHVAATAGGLRVTW